MARISQSSQPSPPPRKRKSDSNADGEPERKRNQKFSHLTPKTKHISQDLIRAEWKSLPKPAQQVVRDIFLAAKRTTLTQIHDGPRRREAEFVVNDVLRRLERQLPRMPFPPGTKAAGLQLDGIMESVRTLEAEKTPLGDSVRLLEEEIEREEQRVEAKRKELARLEKESKAAAKARKNLATKTHLLLEDESTSKENMFSADDVGLASREKASLVFDDDDEDLAPLLSQLQSHLDSIKSNTEQIPAIEEEILKTQDAISRTTATSVT